MKFIQECQKKHLFGSLERNKLPGKLIDYTCELCIEIVENQQNCFPLPKKYLKFKPKQNISSPPFIVYIDQVAQPRNPIMFYTIKAKIEQYSTDIPKANFQINSAIDYKLITTLQCQKQNKQISLINLPDNEVYDSDEQMNRNIFLGDNQQQEIDQDNESQQNQIKKHIQFVLMQYDQKQIKPKQFRKIKKKLNQIGIQLSDTDLKNYIYHIKNPSSVERRPQLQISQDQYKINKKGKYQ